MGRRLVLGLALACACNAKLESSPGDGSLTPNDGSQNHGSDSGSGSDGSLGAWGAPQPIPGASDAAIGEDDCTLSSSETELYFAIPDPNITGTPKQLWVMTRASKTDPWGTRQRVTALNAPVQIESPRLSPDDLTIYYGHAGEIYTATRTAVGQPWTNPTALATVNTASYEKWMAVCDGGYFMVSRANDFYAGQLGSAGTLVTELSSMNADISTFLTNDCLTVYFASNRGGTTQLYTSTRGSTADPWGAPTLVTDFGTADDNEDPWMSPNQRTFVFASVRNGGTTKDLFISTR